MRVLAAHGADLNANDGAALLDAGVIVDQSYDKNQLQIGDSGFGRRPYKRTGQAIGRGYKSSPLLLPFEHRADQFQRTRQRDTDRFSVARHAPGLDVVDMVLQIFADARQITHD